MSRFRTAMLGVAVVSVLSLSASAGFAASPTTAEKRAACTPDFFRHCFSMNPDMDVIEACLRAHMTELTPTCKALFDRYDPPADSKTANSANR
jgi:hypothetical protein